MTEHDGRSWNLAEFQVIGIFPEWECAGRFQKDGLDGLGRCWKVIEADGRFWKASEGPQIPIWRAGKFLHSHMYLV